MVVLDSAAAKECTQKILEEHSISEIMSKDIREKVERWQEEEGAGKGASCAEALPRRTVTVAAVPPGEQGEEEEEAAAAVASTV